MTAERKEFVQSIMNELDRKVGEASAPADPRPETRDKAGTTGGTEKRTEGKSSVGPLKTRACGALALQRR